MKERIAGVSPYLLFLPLLMLCIAIVLVFSKGVFRGDEGRYVWFAENLLQGFYSPPPPDVNLWNGPGYPMILMPFVGLRLSWVFPRLFNAILIYFSAMLFFKTLRLYDINKKKAILCSYIVFCLYYLPLEFLPLLVPEVFAVFLMSAFAYTFCRVCRKQSIRFSDIAITSISLGYLTLTKIIFGYVISAGLLFAVLLYLFRKAGRTKRMVLVYLFALLFCVPYLVYTHSLTNKIFYWGNSGGSTLYWMSTPYEKEFGDWRSSCSQGAPEEVKMRHRAFFDKMSGLSWTEKDAVLKEQAMRNIREHPKKYFTNWVANIGRIFFSYPYSYTDQTMKTYFTIVPNMFLIALSVFFLWPTIKSRNKIPKEIVSLLVLVALYLFGSSLLSAQRRQLYVVVPIIGLWLAYMFNTRPLSK